MRGYDADFLMTCKFNIPFNRDFLGPWPIYAVCMCAVRIISNPSHGHFAPIQLSAGVGVYLHPLPPLRHQAG